LRDDRGAKREERDEDEDKQPEHGEFVLAELAPRALVEAGRFLQVIAVEGTFVGILVVPGNELLVCCMFCGCAAQWHLLSHTLFPSALSSVSALVVSHPGIEHAIHDVCK